MYGVHQGIIRPLLCLAACTDETSTLHLGTLETVIPCYRVTMNHSILLLSFPTMIRTTIFIDQQKKITMCKKLETNTFICMVSYMYKHLKSTENIQSTVSSICELWMCGTYILSKKFNSIRILVFRTIIKTWKKLSTNICQKLLFCTISMPKTY